MPLIEADAAQVRKQGAMVVCMLSGTAGSAVEQQDRLTVRLADTYRQPSPVGFDNDAVHARIVALAVRPREGTNVPISTGMAIAVPARDQVAVLCRCVHLGCRSSVPWEDRVGGRHVASAHRSAVCGLG